MAQKKSNFYLTREQLIQEIILSKKKHRDSNYPRSPAECFTPKLTEYLQLMVTRYANKGQWRGYCLSSDTQALTTRGWFGIDDITPSDIILSYQEGSMIWAKIKSIYRGDYDGKMFHLTSRNMDALVTPGHKFLTDQGLKPVEFLKEKDRLIVLGKGLNPYYTSVSSIDFHPGKNTDRMIDDSNITYPNQPTMDYKGRVWCLETQYGSFVARRNGCVFLTGNSYIEDMKSDALLTLCQNAFKYDETRYDNPFGYYTQIIKYCFITFLEKEELVRDIKDSLWETIGMTPSYARQIKNTILDHAREAAIDRAKQRGEKEQVHKTMKSLKKEVDAVNEKINRLARLIKIKEADVEADSEIAELLELDDRPYTGDRNCAMSLFRQIPEYQVETDIEVAGQTVNCITLSDDSTRSTTKRVIIDTAESTITTALCSIALMIRRDLMVKELRELSGYNINSTRMPTPDKTAVSEGGEFEENYSEFEPSSQKRRPRKKS